MKVQYVEFLYPGVLFTESSMVKCNVTDPTEVEIPERAFGFRLCSRTEVQNGEELLTGEWDREPGVYYAPGAKIYTLAEVKAGALSEDVDILIRNMENNKWEKVIATRFGNIQPWEPTDKLLFEPGSDALTDAIKQLHG